MTADPSLLLIAGRCARAIAVDNRIATTGRAFCTFYTATHEHTGAEDRIIGVLVADASGICRRKPGGFNRFSVAFVFLR